MIVIGLTGSIGMGKSATATLLRRLGVPVYDADAAIHRLLAPGGAGVRPVLAAFGEVGDGSGGIDRGRLGQVVFADPAALRRLEAILHPLARMRQRRFLAASARRRVPLAVLDVPLLYETGADRACTAVIVVTAPGFLQRRRVLSRPGMTEERFAGILRQQMPDAEKRQRTPYVVQTGAGRRAALRQLLGILRLLLTGKRRPASLKAAHSRFGGVVGEARNLSARRRRPDRTLA
jgi:dephospho-CoA kinase